MCIFNHNSNPLTFLQLNFQAPKPTSTPKPTRTRTGPSINLPRSWTPRALKSSGLSEQVSSSRVSLVTPAIIYHTDRQIFTPCAGTQLHALFIDGAIVKGGKSSWQLMCGPGLKRQPLRFLQLKNCCHMGFTQAVNDSICASPACLIIGLSYTPLSITRCRTPICIPHRTAALSQNTLINLSL